MLIVRPSAHESMHIFSPISLFSWIERTKEDVQYLAHTLGGTPVASRIKIGVSGLCFFIVG